MGHLGNHVKQRREVIGQSLIVVSVREEQLVDGLRGLRQLCKPFGYYVGNGILGYISILGAQSVVIYVSRPVSFSSSGLISINGF